MTPNQHPRADSGSTGCGVPQDFSQLRDLARRALPEMWCTESRLFAHKTRVSDQGRYHNIGSNPLYSAISLIGLLEDGAAAERLPAILGPTLDTLHDELAVRPTPALRASFLWAAARAGDSRVSLVTRAMERDGVRSDQSAIALGLTLSGLAAVHEERPKLRHSVARMIREFGDALLTLFEPNASAFTAMSGRNRLRPRLSNFASQVYPVHGLVRAAGCLGTPVPGEAIDAADALVEHQGRMGQWWWQYSTSSRRVIEGYPVYSVHQDGMAFMALAPLMGLRGQAYAGALWRGVSWLFGSNELGAPLVSTAPAMIFRCIQRRGSDPDGFSGMSRRGRVTAALASQGLCRPPGTDADATNLEVLRECRSYHLGWLLYAGRLVAGGLSG